ncbi:MAG: T9SS type A sorting domain-containing protein [Bacteroidales bacterium]|nr:T9SS type A sorting domain-containing protein [Bacteroidales bacterium]
MIVSNLGGVAEVYSVSGQKITSMQLSDNSLNTIDLGYAANGVYLVKIISGEDTFITKVLVK